MSGQPLASLRGVEKRFGDNAALDGIDLDLCAGEVVALLGPNGAGKTTAIEILLGLRRPDGGTVVLFGGDPRKERSRRAIGATPQAMDFPFTLTVSETVQLVQAHFPDPAPLDQLLNRFRLSDLASRQTGGLSGGQRRELAVALAFCGNPQAVFLDEPTTGLDVNARANVWRAIGEYASGGGAVLLTSHYLEEAEKLASRVIVIDRGRVKAEGGVAAIKSGVAAKRVRFTADHVPPLPQVARVDRQDGWYTVYVDDSDQFVSWLVRSGTDFAQLEVATASLEEAFLRITGDTE